MNEPIGPTLDVGSRMATIFNLLLAAALGAYAWWRWPQILSLLP